MDSREFLKRLSWLPPRFLARLERLLQHLPAVRARMEQEYVPVLAALEETLKPYRGEFPTYTRLPEVGQARAEVLHQMEALRRREAARWQEGYASGAVYHGDQEHIEFLNRVYALHSQSNPLHADLWPSASKFESEVVAMTASMLGGEGREVCGVLTSGGTESILLAMLAYREWGRARKGIRRPHMVAPQTAHVAFDKAAHYFGIRLTRTAVGSDLRADVRAIERAIRRETVVIIGSAPTFPHGVIDPIAEMSELAQRRGVGLHVDACLGGFVLPWAEKLGYPVPPFDFRLPGVTSISADTHKYGYAAKGTSVILYRHPELRRYQYFTATDWPGGLYLSPTLAGSRPGALSAACWAALTSLGEQGYLEATRRILETAARIRDGIRAIPELRLLGNPLWIMAFTSEVLDIYRVMDFMAERGWRLNPLQRPAALHIAVTLRHTQPGVAERFLDDLRAAVDHVRAHPEEGGRMAPVYGMAATLPLRGVIRELLERYLDLFYRV